MCKECGYMEKSGRKAVAKTPSWRGVYDQAIEFAATWQGATYERGQSQTFWSDFLAIFGVDRRRCSSFFEHPIKKYSGNQGYIDLLYPGKLLVEHKSAGRDLDKAKHQAFEYLKTLPDHELPEAIVVSDFASFKFIDQTTNETVEFTLEDLPKHIKLFSFLRGQSIKNVEKQEPVDREAAESMARLHNQLEDGNYKGRDLELLLVRLVFLMFAEDSGIFERGVLLEYIINQTAEDGSDLGPRLIQIFETLDKPEDNRQHNLDEVLASLPHVNGALFNKPITTPSFDTAMRIDLIKAMGLDWSTVSPAIFGSMFQGVMDEDKRRDLGAHYTSEVNILKVIKPLFLDNLYAEFRSALRAGPRKKFDELGKLQNKLANLNFLDPACGCGNFLVITYRELRRLEHKIVEVLSKNASLSDMLVGSNVSPLKVDVDQMYGIEIEEFPSLIAQTALWLTDHQMNMEYSNKAARVFQRIPLTTSATIVNTNALTKDWGKIVDVKELDYILGNPPFSGSKKMSPTLRDELLEQFPDVKGAGVLDFVSAWYAKATAVMKQNSAIKSALVSTNSITQGEQVPILWQYLFRQGVSIDFAHRTFKWSNDAKGNAAVYCIIVGFSLSNCINKRIYEYEDDKGEPVEIKANNINAYLDDAPSIFIEKRSTPISPIPKNMIEGITALDKRGSLHMTEMEKDELIQLEPNAKNWIRPWVTGESLLNNNKLYCLWLVDITPNELRSMPKVVERVERVKTDRLQSPYSSKFADRPHTFRETEIADEYLIFPKTGSGNRDYIPLVFIKNAVTSNTCLIIPNATLYDFGILTSRLHMVWMRAIAGQLGNNPRYSKDVYNSFIWPKIDNKQKDKITRLAQIILDARTEYPGATLRALYDPITMPASLRKAHRNLDATVDKLYGLSPSTSDDNRRDHLLKLYRDAKSAK